MGQLEGRAEALSGDFNSQAVANTLWAYATMGRKPGERMMGQLEGRAEAISRDFIAQAVTNILWSFFFFGLHLPFVHCYFLSSLVLVASRRGSLFLAGLNRLDICQVHQFFITCDIEEGLGMRLPASICQGSSSRMRVKLECEFMLGNAIDERTCYQLSIKSLLISYQVGVFGYLPDYL